jgi:hypothetical protein
MNKKTITSLFTAFAAGLAGGFSCCALMLLLFQTTGSEPFVFLVMVGGFANAFISGFICIMIWLPLSLIEKKRIESSLPEDLIRRYLPVITLPLGVVFCIALFLDIPERNNYYMTLIFILNVFCIGYVSLWVFIKRLKSLKHDHE